MEPPPNVLRASKLRTGQIRGRVRTGAKTATKDQERDYLDRFERLAQDFSPLVPEWKGEGSDPFAPLAKRLARRQKKKDSPAWLKWYARGKRLEHAYANTLLIRLGGKIPSFASMKFRGRDVKFILRGRGQRDKLIAIQNFEDPDVRLLGYIDVARSRKMVLVSLDEDLLAYPAGQGIPPEVFASLLAQTDLELAEGATPARCRHADAAHPHIRYVYPQLAAEITVCRACLLKLQGTFTPHIEAYVLAPGGKLEADRHIGGASYQLQPPEARQEFEGMLKAAADEAKERAVKFENSRDVDLLDWALESLQLRIHDRPQGFVNVGEELWLARFDEAAKRFGGDELEQQALGIAWGLRPPRVRAGDAQVGKLLDASWEVDAAPILRQLAPDLDPKIVEELAAQRPSDALAALARALAAEKRFAEYPRFADMDPRVRFVHDLFRAHRTGDKDLYQKRVQSGLKDPQRKPVLLALARAFGQNAAIEWQYAPHEKDQALFYEPPARALAQSTPQTYEENLRRLAEAIGAPVPA